MKFQTFAKVQRSRFLTVVIAVCIGFTFDLLIGLTLYEEMLNPWAILSNVGASMIIGFGVYELKNR